MAPLTDTGGFKYDVFLNFRGEDTRHGFTGNLKKALDDKGVITFMDDDELQKGDEITPSLLEAIQNSMMAVVVLSKNYATSSFCLQELSKILDTMKDKVGRSVLPVFYKVDPSDVRNLKRSYGEAMEKHDEASSSSHEMNNKWKASLHQVANLSGFHYKKGEMYEHEFIEKIVEDVLRKKKPVALHVGDLFGLEDQKQHVISCLNVASDDTIHMVGIHGIGGIGKTTLARIVYNSIADRFEGLCFLENIRENSEKQGLPYLQKILLNKVVRDKNIEVTSANEGITIIQQRLQKKKVLLVLDDVDKEEQLHAIAGSPNWFGLGSRVIITTRDIGLLTCHGVEKYEVKGLNDEDALELVGWKALKNDYSPRFKDVLLEQKYGRELDVNELLRLKDLKSDKIFSGYANILKRAVAYASGLPLALEVIGSHFFKKSVKDCESALERYERIPDKKIHLILKLSYDALEDEEKYVFLDIACCFKGYKLTRVQQILHAHHGDIMKDQINVLVEKSLIKISESGDVTLHDLVEDMGKEIVRQESPKDPRKRIRLWDSKDIIKILEENKVNSEIEMINFNFVDYWGDAKCDGEAFKKMENLKTLIIGQAGFFQSFKHVPNSLRVLEGCICPSSDLPSSSYPKELVICDFRRCPTTNQFEWEYFLKKKFQNMRVLNFDKCQLLTQIPDISGLPNLEEFSIRDCENLIAIDESVGFLDNLKILTIFNCPKIRSVPPLSLASLEELNLSWSVGLESFPQLVNGVLGELKILMVRYCAKIRTIPFLVFASQEKLDLYDCKSLESFSHVVDGLGDKLKTMIFQNCNKLRSIPLLKLESLEKLNISYCHSLENFPPVVDGFLGKLKTLKANNCRSLRNIPPLKLDSLEKLNLSYCYSLESFPSVVDGFLGKLKTLLIKDCRNLKSIPPLKLDSLETLDLSNCRRLESFPHVDDMFLGKLKTLLFRDCHNLKSIPPLKLDSLETLDLSSCYILESFPPVVDGFLGKLKTLLVRDCHNLKSIPPLKLDSLETLDLSSCYSLESFPHVVDGFLGKLKTMLVRDCHNLKSIPPLKLDSLETLDLSSCYILESFPHVDDMFLGKLKTLLVTSCHNLRSFPPLKLDSLEKLDLSNCSTLESFPSVEDGLLDKLKFLSIKHCVMLRSIPALRLTSLEWFDLSYCLSLESFPEILGEMRNVTNLCLDNTPIKELPFQFQNHTLPPKSYPCDCRIVDLPYTRVVAMSKLDEFTIEGEKKVSPVQSLHVEYICLRNCKLSDEYLSTSFMLFANVKELHLTKNRFKVLPKSIEKCHILRRLVLDDCEELQEIEGFPPFLRMLSTLNCTSLTSSCKSKLLNQELNEAGNTCFRLPRAKIPEWFDHQCSAGLSISFWFRNKFPAIALCVVSPVTWDGSRRRAVRVIINGNTFFYTDGSKMGTKSQPNTYHLHLFHMQMENFNDNMDKALLENKWNHAEVHFGFEFQKSGIHVLKEKSNVEDIRFTNPENDANTVFTQDVEIL